VRVLFISQLFDPENAVKGMAFARSLESIGHQVEVVTTFPSYPGGKIYPGFRQVWRQVEQREGVTVVRVPSYMYHGPSAVRRLLSYATFGAMAGLHALLVARKPHIVYAYYPPVVGGLVALVVAGLRGLPYVYDVQDLWPEALIATGSATRDRSLARTIEITCQTIYRRAAKVVVLSDGYKDALVAKGVPADKIERIFNWCDERRVRVPKDINSVQLPVGKFNILYAGNLGAAQALGHVVEAARLLREHGDSRVHFLLMGDGVEAPSLKERVKELALDNVEFLPRVSVEEVGAYLSAADALLVHLKDDPVFSITIPQKTQTYLAMGKPILMAACGEAAEIVRAAGAGLAVTPCRPDSLASAAVEMSQLHSTELQAMARRGAEYYKEFMSMEVGVRAVDRVLREATQNP
jgi:glycosyltransferase involved in cell wall biosynthesis